MRRWLIAFSAGMKCIDNGSHKIYLLERSMEESSLAGLVAKTGSKVLIRLGYINCK